MLFLQEIKDAWLDDIDWTTIKEKAGDHWEQSNVLIHPRHLFLLVDVSTHPMFLATLVDYAVPGSGG